KKSSTTLTSSSPHRNPKAHHRNSQTQLEVKTRHQSRNPPRIQPRTPPGTLPRTPPRIRPRNSLHLHHKHLLQAHTTYGNATETKTACDDSALPRSAGWIPRAFILLG